MTEIDYAVWDFIDPDDGKPRQLRFRQNLRRPTTHASRRNRAADRRSSPRPIAPTTETKSPLAAGATVRRRRSPAIAGWGNWATRYGPGTNRTVDLALIRDRIRAAGLT